MEGRSTAAAWVNGKLTVWASTQNAQIARLILTALGLPPDAIRVVAPDVGGGFGAKIGVDRESIVVAWAAKHTGRPVRWVETRNENLVAMTQGRAQLHHIKIGGSKDGNIKAYRLDVIQDTGAYPRMAGFLPMLTNLMAPGVYDIPAVQADYKVVVTDATPIAAYRAPAGRRPPPPSSGRWTGTPPRRGSTRRRCAGSTSSSRSSSRSSPRRARPTTPASTRAPWTRCSPPPGYEELRAEQRRRREAGDTRQLGIGLACYVEITAADGGGRARPRRSRCTTTAPRPSTPAAPRTARGTTPRSR